MVQKVRVILEDDIHGGAADETVSFSLDGVGYEVDLTAANAARLRSDLQPWISAGRKVTSKRGRAAAGKQRASSGNAAAIREWAGAQGFEVSERGRISAQVRDAYEAAH